MEYGVYIGFGITVLGLLMGSFLGAQVWRLRARHVNELREVGEEYDKREYKSLKPLMERKASEDRSLCLHCGHQLAWYDLVPLLSWASTGGACRYCRKPIGNFEPLMELGTAAFFLVSFLVWYSQLMSGELLHVLWFATWLVAGCLLIILFVYDLKWKLLPDVIVFPLMFVAGVLAELRIAHEVDISAALWSLNWAIVILSGIYFALYTVAERLGKQWVGFGDVKLGLALALMLADWKLAFLALFLANIIGCLVMIPFMIGGKAPRGTVIPFGPFLIIGAAIAALFGQGIIEWYLSLVLVY